MCALIADKYFLPKLIHFVLHLWNMLIYLALIADEIVWTYKYITYWITTLDICRDLCCLIYFNYDYNIYSTKCRFYIVFELKHVTFYHKLYFILVLRCYISWWIKMGDFLQTHRYDKYNTLLRYVVKCIYISQRLSHPELDCTTQYTWHIIYIETLRPNYTYWCNVE